ncbi:hypothetical protein BD410DRAFT_434091 [Rickenella mellea]|uniref:Uncharacterized protein n=1 Tax=Rickenella mellea TaxID=50990 RepID=A0A4Y7PWV4_9AGAM|nr:hypothetical protein BD410DRAFT_434091 [Rickenella mellea]
MPLTELNIDSSSLDAFLRVLGRVKDNNGRLDGNEIWFDDEATPAGGCLDRISILNARRETLVLLRKSLEKSLCVEQKTYRPKSLESQIINRLPFEILGRIFLFSTGQPSSLFEPIKQAKSLSHVNHLFRSVALQTPALWSIVASRQPLALITEYLTSQLHGCCFSSFMALG